VKSEDQFMSRFFKFAMLTTLALAAVAWTAGPAMARPRGGGGHGGGGHGGGGHGGGGGRHGGFGHRGIGFGGWGGYGLGGYYPSYGYGYSYPSYGYGYAYPSYGYSDYGYTYDSGVPYTVGSAPVIVGSAPTPAAQNYTYVEHRDGDNIGRVHVHVPANARVWVDGEATKQKGSDRDFMTPPLRDGQELSYTIKAQWNQDGQNVERTRQVRVKANDTANIDFTAPKKEVERTTTK